MKASLAFVLVAVLTLPCMLPGQAAPDTKPADIQPQSAEAPGSTVGGSVQTPSPAATAQPAAASTAAVLEDGTPVRMRIARTVSSADAKTGDTVDFEVLEDVFVGKTVVIPKGGVRRLLGQYAFLGWRRCGGAHRALDEDRI